MEESPVKKKRKDKKQRPKNCVIHIDSQADDNTLSAFSDQSWKVIMQLYYMCAFFVLNRIFSFFVRYMQLLFACSICFCVSCSCYVLLLLYCVTDLLSTYQKFEMNNLRQGLLTIEKKQPPKVRCFALQLSTTGKTRLCRKVFLP